MTVSMRVMSAGDGYKYLLRTVAAGDGDRSLSTPLTRYYNAEGTPPGRWLGAGVATLGGGRISVGDQVSEAQLQLLVGMGRDPITGEPLGRAYPTYKGSEPGRASRGAVAGFDLTFTVPKSASVLWALGDPRTQDAVLRAHRAAVDEALLRVGLTSLAGRQIGRLSGGQKKRAFVARAIAQDARVLLLDEPFAGVDKPSEAMITQVLTELAAEGRGVIVSTHDLAGLPGLASDVVLLRNRVLFHGDVATGLEPRILARAFGWEEGA